MASQQYDAIVACSGIAGGLAAKALCEKGLKMLLLEGGRNVEYVSGDVNATKAPWELEHHGMTSRETIRKYPKLRCSCTLWEPVAEFFANEQECPYVEAKPFDWVRGYQVGGRSLTCGRLCLRMSDFDFEARSGLEQLDAASRKDYGKSFLESSPAERTALLIGCTKALRYVETPGSYDGNVPYKKADKAWHNPSRRIS